MNAIKIETTVDEATARVIPGLRPLLGKRVELIALQAEGEPNEVPARKLTVEELFAAAVKPTPGSPPLTQDDIDGARCKKIVDSHSPGTDYDYDNDNDGEARI